MTAATAVDLTEAAFVADPYPVLAELRAAGPLLWHEPSGRWLATDHASVSAVLRDRSLGRLWTDHQPDGQMAPFNALHRHQMMENEPPEHTRLRRLVAKAFGRGHVERMKPRIEALAERMLGELSAGETVDILAAYAEPLPVYVICELLGVPGEDHLLLRDWSKAIVAMYEQDVDEVTRQTAVESSRAFTAYVEDLVAERRTNLGDDLISHLIEARDGEGKLDDRELVASVVLLLNAGHEASVNVFGNGLNALLRHPAQQARLASGEVGIDVALEELIRYDAPLQLFERTATADVEIAGERIEAGQTVACLMGAANRDEAVFAHADVFDVGRDPNPHVGFGLGLHFCLGAPLARVELAVTFAALLARFPGVALAAEPPRRPTWVLRGFETIEVTL